MLLVPLTVKQIHSMQNMQAHAPEMKEIQRKYKGDRQKLNEELMKFYKEKNINPASSCLPLLAQFPIFIGLYYTLRNFAKHPPPRRPLVAALRAEHRRARRRTHWSGYVLLAVYVASQLASTYFMSGIDAAVAADPHVHPPVRVHLRDRSASRPGLVLYWMTTNLWTVGQGLITRRLIPKVAPPAETGPKTLVANAAEGRARRGRRPAATGSRGRASAQPPSPPRKVKRKKKARR